ncbi:MAG: NAD(P)/FAD-dependent oxidoreductase [Hyphomicrobiaceae bacterium]
MVRKHDCLVLGAGMVGVSTALKLQEKGRDVVLVDRRPAGEGTSYGNAGLIQAEGVVPYMLPRDVSTLFKFAINSKPQAHVHYRALLTLAPWLARYWWNSGQRGLDRGTAAHVPLAKRCVEEHEALISAAGVERLMSREGYLRVVRDTKDLEAEEREHKRLAERYGILSEVLNPDKLAELEPHLARDELVGAIHLPAPRAISNPGALVKAYADLFRSRGGHFITADAATLENSGGAWQVQTVEGPVAADHAIVALGPWSAEILRNFGVSVPLAVKRGYHMHYKARGNATLNRPVLDVDNGFVLAPMEQGIRLTTGAEFAYRDAPKTPKQLAMVEPAARTLFPLGDRVEDAPWLGARPCLPDMIPAIGPVPRNRGLWANFGHQHWGLTLGPITGRLLAEMITGSETVCNPTPYRLDRF